MITFLTCLNIQTHMYVEKYYTILVVTRWLGLHALQDIV